MSFGFQVEQGNLRFGDIGFIVYLPEVPVKPIGPLVGGFVAVIIFLLLVVALMYVYFQRRHKHDKKQISETKEKLLESIRLLKLGKFSKII